MESLFLRPHWEHWQNECLALNLSVLKFLTIAWQIRQMNTLLDEHYPLKSKLDDLNIRFAMPGIKKQVL